MPLLIFSQSLSNIDVGRIVSLCSATINIQTEFKQSFKYCVAFRFSGRIIVTLCPNIPKYAGILSILVIECQHCFHWSWSTRTHFPYWTFHVYSYSRRYKFLFPKSLFTRFVQFNIRNCFSNYCFFLLLQFCKIHLNLLIVSHKILDPDVGVFWTKQWQQWEICRNIDPRRQ